MKRSRLLGFWLWWLLPAAGARAELATVPPLAPAPGWIVVGYALRLMQQLDPALTRRWFDRPTTYVMGDLASAPVPAGWHCRSLANFKSYRAFAAALEQGKVRPDWSAIMYDNESWAETPAEEQPLPEEFERRFAALAHAHGYAFVATPALDIARRYPGADLRQPQSVRFLRCGFPRAAAGAPADLLNLQAQSLQGAIGPGRPATSSYREFLTEAATQARAANPQTVLYAGISTARGTAEQMLNAVLQSRGMVSGYWLNIPGPKPDGAKAIDFLRRLEAAHVFSTVP